MTRHDELVNDAELAIERVEGNASVSQARTLEDMIDLRDLCQEIIDALKATMDDEEGGF